MERVLSLSFLYFLHVCLVEHFLLAEQPISVKCCTVVTRSLALSPHMWAKVISLVVFKCRTQNLPKA